MSNPLHKLKCMKKRCYESEAVAINNIKQMEKSHASKQKAYKCNNCGAWHTATTGPNKGVGSSPKPLKTRGLH